MFHSAVAKYRQGLYRSVRRCLARQHLVALPPAHWKRKKVCMKFARVAGLVAMTAMVSLAGAQEIHNWRSSVTGWVWKDASGQCWRDASWTPATAAPGCDGAIAPVAAAAPAPAPAPIVAAPAPVAAPEPVAAAPAVKMAPVAEVAPAPVVEAPAPAPKAAPAPAVVAAPAPAPAPAPVVAAPAVKPAPGPVKMSFAADAFFDFDKSVLKAEGKAKLKDLVAKIKNISLEVVIAVGHTDSVGTDAYNQKLSERRAEAVKAFLISLGIPKSRIYTEGKGESAPAADNKTPAGRAKNRRVEVEVVGTK
jgi:OOP family OmpA-OmpF porin